MDPAHGSTQTQRAAYALRRRIVSGELPGGTRLTEVALADDLAISRTPVREAMSRLAEEGLLVRARGGGFEVRSFTLRDALDAVELRGVLEGTAARRAAERGAPEDELARLRDGLARIDAAFADGMTAQTFGIYSEQNHAFHEALGRLAGSDVIARELARVRSLPFASPSAFVFRTGDRATEARSLIVGQAQHWALVSAIAGREGTRAEAIAREHAQIARGNLEAALDAGWQPGAPLPGMAMIVG
ncbi:GntR family transcriptional regulator [Wenxinia marina]|uniref:Transcriptional regulator, GntR family n=1 Tax=Wenxinia marina DSM 24838 TaxID=1123501 RepID=A0A0D0Q8D1_9RHOB|nr:GntR family transcriptional regulator [Wenxinia marina]KIQ68652.1 transcriptional regulator, GntR family [Wenxinia marina DSM 24838]GGL67658.1 GntR family transcriptional regulator [Wenxinia marina]